METYTKTGCERFRQQGRQEKSENEELDGAMIASPSNGVEITDRGVRTKSCSKERLISW
jgi:hypothetical protein